MHVELINPARDEYLKVFEMILNGLRSTPNKEVLRIPGFEYIKFGIPEDADGIIYYIPEQFEDPRITILQKERKMVSLNVIWKNMEINELHYFAMERILPMMVDVIHRIIARDRREAEVSRLLLWKYVPPVSKKEKLTAPKNGELRKSNKGMVYTDG